MTQIIQLEKLFGELEQADTAEDKTLIIKSIRTLASEIIDFQALGIGLAHLLKHPDVEVRSCFAEILGNNKVTSMASGILEALKFEKNIDARMCFVDALGRMGDRSALPLLIGILTEPIRSRSEMRLHWHVADALGLIEDTSAVDALVTALIADYSLFEPSSSDLREAAAGALSRLRSQSTGERLIAELKKEELHPIDYKDEAIRCLIAKTLGELKLEIAIRPLIELLKQTKPNVRAAAGEALGNYGGDEVIEALSEAMSAEDKELRFCASLALKRISDNSQ
ncbi:MAG: HEAT repeat domain-containing protein [Anaerolineae bacterium]|nr:HEAT repeat domain-containing protein [Anaerolineae bacterium]